MRIAAIGAGLWLCAASGPGPTIPEPDECDGPGRAGSVTAVEFGDPAEGEFVPWQAGETVSLTIGGQGTAMVGVRLRLTGDDVPACLAHLTQVWYSGAAIASDDYAVNTYEDAGGGRTTRAMFLILGGPEPLPGESFELRTTVGALSESLEVTLEGG